ncbi:hypothetical protein [Escherichia coli]|uniref:hypothetical protein n=1 Tax=Escherichia coli TaxID=562 RepID=UPI00202BAEA9|nr:hypothetical protein [Escherichia coli]
MALIVRMRNLNVLTEWQYNSLMRDATAKGYRTGEPGGIERERSLIIEKMMAARKRRLSTVWSRIQDPVT